MKNPGPNSPTSTSDVETMRQAIELLFFAYRDFTGEADEILKTYGFGRAHHRVIYFVGRNPGITVNGLLAILKITKQSLSRVLGQLIDEGFVEQMIDQNDRRRRMMWLTEKAEHLDAELTAAQSRLLSSAFADAGDDAVNGFRTILRKIINQEDRARMDPFFEDKA